LEDSQTNRRAECWNGENEQDVYERGDYNGNASENCLWEDKPEAESKTQEELSLIMQLMGNDAGMIFF
jgi:hypothetical protein